MNDLIPAENLAYLLRYDSVYGRYQRSVEHADHGLVIDGKKYPLFNKKDPSQLPWGDMWVDLVFECTGVFTNREKLASQIEGGAKAAILSAPIKGGERSFEGAGRGPPTWSPRRQGRQRPLPRH